MKPTTIFCDIDGTLVSHSTPIECAKPSYTMTLLPGTLEKLAEWDRAGYNIVLVTGRKESLRKVTEQQLSAVGIFYDQLIMGIGSGTRIMINDTKPTGDITAVAINLNRNQGIQQIEI
jgi:ribonucleotide monophosphatase NagD (HAD superfamily)